MICFKNRKWVIYKQQTDMIETAYQVGVSRFNKENRALREIPLRA
jgi:hypothetical protein